MSRSNQPLVLITGFGLFEDRLFNPSRELALRLQATPPVGVRTCAAELPVSFGGVAAAIDEVVDRLQNEGERPDVLLGIGVQRDGSMRLEQRARGHLAPSERVDNDGAATGGVGLELGADRATDFDLDRCAGVLRSAGAPWAVVSEDAGGYVCERTYHHLLGRAEGLGARALFLHVPPASIVGIERQERCVRALVVELAARARR